MPRFQHADILQLQRGILLEKALLFNRLNVDFSSIGQTDRTGVPVEERHADRFFQLLNRHAERRLGDKKLLRSLRKAPLLIDFIDVLHIQLH